jgi:8-oxo-dGTP diphosphatase
MNRSEYQLQVRCGAIPAVYLIIPDNRNRILMMLRDGTGYMDGMWDLPSGHIEPGELPKKAMVREAKEEVGIVVKQRDVALVHASYRPKHDNTDNRVDLVFEAEAWRGVPRICEPDKCAKIAWIHRCRTPRKTVPHVKRFIAYWINGIAFSEFGSRWLRGHGLDLE